MKEKASGSRKRRFVRIMQWRILACLVPFLVLLITGVLFWFEGRLDRALSATSLSLGQQSALLAASAVRHSEDFGSGPLRWDPIAGVTREGGAAPMEIISLENEVLYTTNPTNQGRTYRRFTDSPCIYCHVAGSPRASAENRILSEPGAVPYQIFAAPLLNRAGCRSCHQDKGEKLGMVYFRQDLSPAHRLIRNARIVLILVGVMSLGLTILSTRTLLDRYLSRPRQRWSVPGPAAPAAATAPPVRPAPAANAGVPSETAESMAERLQESLRQIEQQRDELSMLYFIADQLSRSIQPNIVPRRGVELASSVFGSVCVLIAGHFHPDSRAFHGTVTYKEPNGAIVERPYPDVGVARVAPYYNASIVERWLQGELDGLARLREEPTVAYPLERHGRRLGLLLAPARARTETLDGRPTAASPEVVQVARKHLAIALEMSELQRERLQEERLAAIGQTVAGLSHCMKNTLNGLKGGKFIIERALSLENPEKLKKGLAVLNTSIQHIERLTHDMLFYAADRAIDLKPANPNDTILEIIDLLEENARSQGVELRADLDPNMVPIPLDRHALYRAILNLTTNAIDACVESDRGNAVTLKSVMEYDSVLITVQDNGIGIPEELLRRITERFYTTKSSKGTGLGLPVVQKIAELHGGRLEVESVLGQGSSFHLRIPRHAGRA